jgi:uncharacterized protein
MNIIELIREPWPWYVAGPIIALVFFLISFFGRSFGVSDSLRTMCSIGGAGKKIEFFDFNWKNQLWNIVFIAGAALGGFIANQFLSTSTPVELHPAVIANLQQMNITTPEPYKILPESIFSFEALFTLRGFIALVIGGFFVGFGARYAGGCTSGHAISGLSNLQLPSLIAVIGFFIGGLLMTHILLPIIMSL